MANLSSTSATNNSVNEVHSNDNQIFDNVDYQLNQEMHQGEHLDSDAETEIDDNTIPYHQYLLNIEAKSCSPALYDADTLLHLTHQPVSIWDSEEVLVQQVVSMKKMSEKPGHVRPANGFYEKLNALMFVPQQELSREQAYWLPANERASQTSNPNRPVTPYVHKSRPPSQVLASLRNVNAAFLQFLKYHKERNNHKKPDYSLKWCFDYARKIREFEQIFDDLETEYEQCVLDNKNLTIEKKNLLIKNDCLIAECLEKDICSIVFTSDSVVPPSSNCLCEDLRSACDREHTKVLELEAEISKQKQLITESEKRFAFLEQNYVNLQLKFQNYKQCIDTSSASNAIFEINKLRQQLQGKDDTIRNLDAQINIMKVLNVGTTEGSCDQQALETDRIQLKDTITSLRIQLDGLKVENVSLKRRYDELSKANTHSRTAYTEKLSAFTAEHTKLKAQVTGTTSSGPFNLGEPNEACSRNVQLGSKYIYTTKRYGVKPTPLPKKDARVKPLMELAKTVPKRAPRNHSSLPAKSGACRRDHGTTDMPLRTTPESLVLAPNHYGSLGHSITINVWVTAVVLIVRCIWESGMLRPLTGDRARLINFVEKFIGTVRFGNDEYAAIIGYGSFVTGGLEVLSEAFMSHPQLRICWTTQRFTIKPTCTHLMNVMLSASPVSLLTKASSTSHGYSIVG
ncbi:hypothetical protein Tco_0747369 [Tanacetum coccineum]|uniref:Integrase, catalytic region, zinc finger, CCHC-type, peptidase aspartic, catalytic n=1 Tax=Tanacetum coccineum TaxID=301880 RepID=A0ABQ4YW09_9ASTR